LDEEKQRLETTWIQPASDEAKALQDRLSSPLTREYSLADLIRRPELSYTDVASLRGSPVNDTDVAEQVEVEFKYAGYIERQRGEIEQMRKQENTALPDDLDYDHVGGLSNELKSKLQAVKPVSIAQASRIQGMTPAAISLLLVYLKKRQLVAKQARKAAL